MTSRLLLLCLSIVFWEVTRLHAATYIVTNTNDTGAGSLREAITSANTVAGADNITFTIPANDRSTFTTWMTVSLGR